VALSDTAIRRGGQALRKTAQGAFRFWLRAAVSFTNMAWPISGDKNWAEAIDAFKGLIDKYPTHADAKDASFQLGACYAEQANWPASAEVLHAFCKEVRTCSADETHPKLLRVGVPRNSTWETSTPPRRPSAPSCLSAKKIRE